MADKKADLMDDHTTGIVVRPKERERIKGSLPILILVKGPAALVGKQWVIDKKSMTLGRFPSSEIHISENSLSKAHARFTVADGLVSLSDLDATNGTQVNGKNLTPFMTYQLRSNDQIKAGNVLLKFIDEGSN